MRGLEARSGDQRKPRLLVLASTYPRWQGDHEPGFVHELSRRLVRNFDVTVLCPHASGASAREVMDGVSVVRYRYAPEKLESLVSNGGLIANLKVRPWKILLLPTFFLGQLLAILLTQRSFKPDVIHAHWLIPQGFAVSVMQLLGAHRVPFVVTSHGADLFALRGRVLNLIKRFVLRKASGISVVSRVMEGELRRLGVQGKKVDVQPMGVELGNVFKPNPLVERAQTEILFVGRLVEKKGLCHLIDAMPMILESYHDCLLRVVGFGPEEVALKRQASALGLKEHVVFEGAIPNGDLPHYYQRASVFVAPFVQAENGDQEGLGLVLVEAIGCGCPAVVSDLPAVEDVVVGLKGVVRVPEKDVAAIAQAVVTVFDHFEKFTIHATDSAQLLRERFDWDSVSDVYASILKKAVRGCDFRNDQAWERE